MVVSTKFPSPLLRPFGSSESDHIFPDLLLLILHWFPVQTLLVCRSVCKYWKQIIDSTSFILNHLSHQKPRILLQNRFDFLLLDTFNRPIYDTLKRPDWIDLESLPSHLRAVSTIHGVVCLFDHANNLFLWNPSIGRHLRIPLPTQSSVSRKTDWCKHCGFWMDPFTKDFKIVIFYIGVGERGGSVFSSKDQKWREIPAGELFGIGSGDYVTTHHSPCVMIDGLAHWTATYQRDCFGGLIVYYDFVQEKFGEIKLPDKVQALGSVIFSI